MDRFVLEILDGDRAGSVIPLLEDRLRIGRRPENDLVLGDEKVSGRHAEVVFEEGRHVLRDLESTNGTLMDGRRVEEVVLTDRDVFQIGRIRLSFHLEGEAPEPELQLHQMTTGGLRGASRSTPWLAVMVVALLLGGAGLYYRLNVGPGRGGITAQRPPLRVPGNRLSQLAASCEGDEEWDLKTAGDGFDYGSRAHSGGRALWAPAVDGGAGFALARSREPVKVRESLVVTGFLRTEGDARIAVRLRFSSSLEDEPLVFTTGTPAESFPGPDYRSVQWEVAVPPPMDQAQVELLALLPAAGDAAFADDLAIEEAGAAEPIDQRAGGRLIGSGASFAVRLLGGPAVVGVRPLVREGPLLPVARAGLATLSDAGVGVTVEPGDPSLTVRLEGGSGLVLDLPEGALQSVLQRRDDGPFTRLESESTADEILLGAGSSRLLVGLPEGQTVRPEQTDLALPGAFELRLRMLFTAERDRAAAELESAREAVAEDPGQALDRLQTVLDHFPHDTGKVREALELRAALVAARDRRIEELRASLETALFFRTRGGFVRVRDGLQQLVDRYGRQLDRDESVAAMQREVEDAIAALDREVRETHARRLEALASVLSKSGQEELANLVRDDLRGR